MPCWAFRILLIAILWGDAVVIPRVRVDYYSESPQLLRTLDFESTEDASILNNDYGVFDGYVVCEK